MTNCTYCSLVDNHGIGKRGYTWLHLPSILQDAYPCSGMDGTLSPFENSECAKVPQLKCPKAMKCPTPPFHSIVKSKTLFLAHIMFQKQHIKEADSPFFGIFPDDEMTVLVEFRDKDVPPPEIKKKRKLPFRGEGWKIKNSVWADRRKQSDSRDYWDTDKTYRKAFKYDWELVQSSSRMEKFFRRLLENKEKDDSAQVKACVTHCYWSWCRCCC